MARWVTCTFLVSCFFLWLIFLFRFCCCCRHHPCCRCYCFLSVIASCRSSYELSSTLLLLTFVDVIIFTAAVVVVAVVSVVLILRSLRSKRRQATHCNAPSDGAWWHIPCHGPVHALLLYSYLHKTILHVEVAMLPRFPSQVRFARLNGIQWSCSVV